MSAEAAAVLDAIRLQEELRWCRRLRALVELLPVGFSLAEADGHLIVSRTDEQGIVVMDRVLVRGEIR